VIAASAGGPQGLIVSGSDVTIRGVVLNGGFSYTVSLSGANGKVQGCFIGTDAAGSAAVGPNIRGVYSNGSGSTVGGPLPADRNLIAGNQSLDIWSENTPDLLVQGNLIGTDASGAALIGSFTGGIVVSPARAGGVIRNNVVGGVHNGSGMYIGGAIDFGTTVQGNFVGTDVTGTVKPRQLLQRHLCRDEASHRGRHRRRRRQRDRVQ
jgi:titin